jgi:O-antigen ligase
MTLIDPATSSSTATSGVVGALGLVLVYGFCFWRIFRNNLGDRFIECASITVMLMFAAMACMRIPHFPDWIQFSLMMLSGIMSFVSIFFGLQQAYRAIRSRRLRRSNSAEPE